MAVKLCSSLIGPLRATFLWGMMASSMITSVGFAQDDYQPTILITGSNQGIGYEFARQYAARGWRVLATTRRPERAQALETLAG